MVKKKPCIPSIYRSVKLVSDIKKKCDLFNSYFEEQCTAVVNDSKLPSVLTVHTESLLESFYFSADHIRDIKKLDPNKAHGYDMMSIRMLKLPKRGYISWWMEKSQPIHQKNNKQILSNYRPVSLLSVCSKIFERLKHNSMYKHISDNLLSPSQPGFCTGDSSINRLRWWFKGKYTFQSKTFCGW